MAEERSDDALSAADEALDALRAELRATPSPDFQARVRQRIAGRRTRARRWVWLLPAAAALVAVFVMLRGARQERGPATAVARPPVPTEAPTRAMPSPRPTAAAARTTHRVAARPVVEPVRPLVPRGEGMQIARYVAKVRARPFADESLPYSDPSTPLVQPAAIASAPLQITPVREEGSPR